MVRRIFTGKDIEFSDGRKMQFGDTALRDIDKDTGEFLQSEEDKKMEMTELRS